MSGLKEAPSADIAEDPRGVLIKKTDLTHMCLEITVPDTSNSTTTMQIRWVAAL